MDECEVVKIRFKKEFGRVVVGKWFGENNKKLRKMMKDWNLCENFIVFD